MSPPKLFDENSDEDDINLKTENAYAKNYDRWREKEELHKRNYFFYLISLFLDFHYFQLSSAFN